MMSRDANLGAAPPEEKSFLPSIFSMGSVVPPDKSTKKQKHMLANTRAIDFVLEFIEKRMPRAPGEYPAIRAKRPGDKVICLKSGTGSGKSTVLPVELYKKFAPRGGGEILVTQPRVLNAIDIVKQIVKHNEEMRFGANIGYQTGPLTRKPTMRGILLASIGILTNKLSIMPPEKFVKRYQFIVIDEVHDRSKELDAALLIVKKLLADYYEHPMCPIVILMSATFDEKIFMRYFGSPKENYIKIEGRTYPIDIRYSPFDVGDYIGYAFRKIRQIHFDNIADVLQDVTVRDIIVFVQSNADSVAIEAAVAEFNRELIEKGFEKTKLDFQGLPDEKKWEGGVEGGAEGSSSKGDVADRGAANYLLAPVKLSSETFGRVEREFKDLYAKIAHMTVTVDGREYPASRKVIVSTPVAETGVTLETLKYCIDTGFRIAPEYNPIVNAPIVKHSAVTQSMSDQRIGRVGRKAPGVAYPCYTQDTYNQMLKDDFSQFVKDDISSVLLLIIVKETTALNDNPRPDLIRAGETFRMHTYSSQTHYHLDQVKKLNIATMDYVEQPSAAGIISALEKLHMCGFIDAKYQITPEGFFASKLQKLSVECIRAIFSTYAHGSSTLDMITIASFLSVQKVFGRKYVARKVGQPDSWMCEFIDYLFVWDEFCDQIDKLGTRKSRGVRGLRDWTQSQNINFESLLRVSDMRTGVIENFIQVGLDPFYNGLQMPQGTYSLREILKRPEEGLAEIIKIKKSLVSGFRMNIAAWNAKSKQYVGTYRNIVISVDSPVLSGYEAPPHHILVGSTAMVESMMAPGRYEFSGKCISALDGFVRVDAEMPRR